MLGSSQFFKTVIPIAATSFGTQHFHFGDKVQIAEYTTKFVHRRSFSEFGLFSLTFSKAVRKSRFIINNDRLINS